MVKTNAEYCHDWQRQLAAVITRHKFNKVDLLLAIVEINRQTHPNRLVDNRYFLTIKPFGHPDKRYYGLTVSDMTHYRCEILGRCPSFVGWIEANELAPYDVVATESCRISDFSSGDGIEHLGALEYGALYWNYALRHYDIITRHYNKHMWQIRDAVNEKSRLICHLIAPILKTVGKK